MLVATKNGVMECESEKTAQQLLYENKKLRYENQVLRLKCESLEHELHILEVKAKAVSLEKEINDFSNRIESRVAEFKKSRNDLKRP